MTASGLGEGARHSTSALFSLTKKRDVKQFILLSAAEIRQGVKCRTVLRHMAHEMVATDGTAVATWAVASALQDLPLQECRMSRNRLGGLLPFLVIPGIKN